MNGLLEPRRRRAFADLCTRIIAAISDLRPAIVLSGLRKVQFVTAARAMFGCPELLCLWVQSRTLNIAVTK